MDPTGLHRAFYRPVTGISWSNPALRIELRAFARLRSHPHLTVPPPARRGQAAPLRLISEATH